MKLRHWYMVHGKLPAPVSLQSLNAAIRLPLAELVPDFGSSAEEWTKAELRMRGAPLPTIMMRRIQSGEADFMWSRDDWESELRTWPPTNCDLVVEHLRETRQTIAITHIYSTLSSAKLARVCEQLCGCAARATDGLIHVYQEGFFSAEGDSLFPYSPKHRLKTR